MATEFTANFELPVGVADEDPFNAADAGFFNKSGTWLYETTSPAQGSAFIDVVNPGTTTSAITYVHAAGLISTRYYDICLKVAALPTAETMVLQIRASGNNRAQVTIMPDGSIRMKNGTTAVGTSAPAGTVVAGEWFRVKWGITGSTQELRIYTDPTPANLFGSAVDHTIGPANYSQGTWDQFRFGVMTSEALTLRVDRLVIDDSTWPTSGGGGNITPTANAGPDQDSVIGGTTVTLDGTGSSDPDGTIVEYAWTQTAGPTVTLSSQLVAQPTFVAPTTAGSATFQLRVKDNNSAQSTADTVTITWSAAGTGSNPTSDFYEKLLGASVGATVSDTNTDFDVVDTGWTFASPLAGTSGIGVAQVTGNGAVKILTHILPAGLVSVRYVDAIFVISDLSLGPWYIMRALSGGTVQATVRVNTNGGVQCRNGTTAVGTETSTKVVAGEPFRVAWHVNNGGTQTARLYTGANLFGTAGSSDTSGAMNSGTFDRIGFGIAAPAVASGNIKVAIPQVEATTWPEPFGGSVPSPESGIFRIDTGPTYTPIAFDRLPV